MSEEYLYAEEIPTEEPIVEEPIEEMLQRLNPFCVIRKEPWGEYNVHDIQDNCSWSDNPYGDEYAVVPDDMVLAIKETKGFCDIVLNEDGTEVVEFTAKEIPEIPEQISEPSQLDLIEAQVAYTALMTDTLL